MEGTRVDQENQPELISLTAAAKLLGIHQNTLRNWADKGLIAHVRLPSGHRRFTFAEIRRLRDEMAVERGTPKKAAA